MDMRYLWTAAAALLLATSPGAALPPPSTAPMLPVTADLELRFETVGTSPLATVGTQVTTWVDQAGAADDAVEVAASGPDLIAQTTPGGRDALRFNGDYLEVTSVPALATQTLTWFAVFRDNIPNDIGFLTRTGYTSGAGANSGHVWDLVGINGAQYAQVRNSSGGGLYTTGPLATSDTWYVVSVVWNASASAVNGNPPTVAAGALNGVAMTPSGPGADANVSGHVLTRIGANASAPASQLFNGDMAAFLVYTDALSAADRAEVEEYLTRTYILSCEDLQAQVLDQLCTDLIAGGPASGQGFIEIAEQTISDVFIANGYAGPDDDCAAAILADLQDEVDAGLSGLSPTELVLSQAELRLETVGAGPVTTSGARVTTWHDQAAPASDAVENAASGPNLVTAGTPTGEDSLDFLGSDFLEVLNEPALDSQTLTWFVVFRADTTSAIRTLTRSAYTSGAGGGGQNYLWGAYFSSSVLAVQTRALSGGEKGVYPAFSDIGSWHVVTGVWNGSGTVVAGNPAATISVRLDGATLGSASGADADPLGHNTTFIGAAYSASQPAQWYYDGQLAAVLVFTDALSAADVALVEAYLQSTYIGP